MHHIKNQPEPKDAAVPAVMDVRLADPNLINEVSDWQLDFRQLKPGPMETRIRAQSGPLLSLLDIRMGRAVHQTGLAPPGTVTVGIPLTDGLVRWQGRDVRQGDLLPFGPPSGFDGVSDASFHGLTFSIPREEVELICERQGLPLQDPLHSSGMFADQMDTRRLLRLALGARRYLYRTRAVSRTFEEDLVAGLLRIYVAAEATVDRSSSRARTRAVRIALDLMQESVEDNLPISHFCQAADVSERTLNRAFNERFDIGPKAYYLRLRLGRVRRDLVSGEGPQTISDIANRWGFWHLGQLASDYLKQFGELPSETLGRSNSRC